jgi:O-antigen ligase
LLVWIVVISAVVFSVVGMVYYYVIMDSAIMKIRFGGLLAGGRYVWTELPVNAVGTLSITAILFCFYFYHKKISLWYRLFLVLGGGIVFVATILTQSRGTLAAVIVAGITLFLIKNKKLLPVFLVIMILAVVFSPFKNRIDTRNLSARMKINYIVMQVVKDHPLLGIGFGMMTFSETLDIKEYVHRAPPEYRPVDINHPHSWLLDIMVRLGIIGLGLFMLIIFTFFKMSWHVIRYPRDNTIRELGIYVDIAFISYFVIGLAEPVFLFSASAIIFYILMAMMTILWMLNRDESPIFEKPQCISESL